MTEMKINGAGQRLVEFPLISRLKLPLFALSNESMERIDLSRMNRDNLLREIVQLKDKFKEPLQYESIDSRTISTLLNFPVFKTHDEFVSGLDSLMGHIFEAGTGPDKVIRSIMD